MKFCEMCEHFSKNHVQKTAAKSWRISATFLEILSRIRLISLMRGFLRNHGERRQKIGEIWKNLLVAKFRNKKIKISEIVQKFELAELWRWQWYTFTVPLWICMKNATNMSRSLLTLVWNIDAAENELCEVQHLTLLATLMMNTVRANIGGWCWASSPSRSSRWLAWRSTSSPSTSGCTPRTSRGSPSARRSWAQFRRLTTKTRPNPKNMELRENTHYEFVILHFFHDCNIVV